MAAVKRNSIEEVIIVTEVCKLEFFRVTVGSLQFAGTFSKRFIAVCRLQEMPKKVRGYGLFMQ